ARARRAGALSAGILALALLACGAACAASAANTPRSAGARPHLSAADNSYCTRLPAGRFGTVSVYIPEALPRSVAIFPSGDGGWQLGVIGMARALTDMGAVVVGADIRPYLGSLKRSAQRAAAPCQMLAADFEALSHQVQKEIGLSEYHVPVLIGYSSGANVGYATLVQAPPGPFAGALSLGFCADQDFAAASLCPGAGLHYTRNPRHELVFEPAASLKQPWIALQGQKDQVCSPHAVDEFAAQVANAQVVKLPLVGHGFALERAWRREFHDAYARLT